MKLLHAAIGRAKCQCGRAVKPVRQVYDREIEEARKSNSKLSSEQLTFIAVASLGVVILTLMMRGMYFSKYAAMTTEDFQAYHPWVPVFALASSTLYLSAIYLKGVRYWLAYFPAAMTVLASVVFLLLYHGRLDPSALEFMDFGPAWWRGA